MKKKLIKIDLRTLKRNPDANKMHQRFPTAPDITFTFKGENLPEEFKNEENCLIEAIQYKDNNPVYYEGQIFDMKPFEKLVNVLISKDQKEVSLIIAGDLTIHQKNNFIDIHTFPQPLYLYKYVNTKLKCKECGETFRREDFQHFEYEDGWDYSYTERGCPHCGEWDCCSVEYENVDDALKRSKK